MKKGIDVSAHQGSIDWNAVKSSGIDFTILRCGYGNDDPDQDDAYFLKNVKACEKVGMPYGVYLYSYATSVEDAKSEAAHVMRLIKGLKPEYPIYYDLEDPVTGNCSNEKILQIAKTFVTTLEKAGYWVGIYANKHWNTSKLTDKWYDGKARWVAQYNDKCMYDGEYGMWQYSSSGHVKGITGYVDMNYAYVDYPKSIKSAGRNGFTKSTNSSSNTTTTTPTKKSNTEIAKEIIAGKWGNGEIRKTALTNAGYNYDEIQKEVNKLLNRKSIEQIAKEVISGKWGNGDARKKALTKAGYDYEAVQKKVNELL